MASELDEAALAEALDVSMALLGDDHATVRKCARAVQLLVPAVRRLQHAERSWSDALSMAGDEKARADRAEDALRAARQRIAELERTAMLALVRSEEWAPAHVIEAAYGLGPLNTDAGEALNDLRLALGVTVTRSTSGYEFATPAAREGE